MFCMYNLERIPIDNLRTDSGHERTHEWLRAVCRLVGMDAESLAQLYAYHRVGHPSTRVPPGEHRLLPLEDTAVPTSDEWERATRASAMWFNAEHEGYKAAYRGPLPYRLHWVTGEGMDMAGPHLPWVFQRGGGGGGQGAGGGQVRADPPPISAGPFLWQCIKQRMDPVSLAMRYAHLRVFG